ncbi:NUDIX pyrophosphatase [Planctomycetota bacterium]|nr:NUDIX pyrophosphatase [Planctomycetota bacterium]
MSRLPYNILVIPYRIINNDLVVAIFFNQNLSMCQFIAGGGENDETPFDAARRETYEESGIKTKIENWIELDSKASIPRTAFPKANWPNNIYVITEHSFAVLTDTFDIQLSHEHKLFEWVKYDDACKKLTWDSNRVALFELKQRLVQSAQQVDAPEPATMIVSAWQHHIGRPGDL